MDPCPANGTVLAVLPTGSTESRKREIGFMGLGLGRSAGKRTAARARRGPPCLEDSFMDQSRVATVQSELPILSRKRKKRSAIVLGHFARGCAAPKHELHGNDSSVVTASHNVRGIEVDLPTKPVPHYRRDDSVRLRHPPIHPLCVQCKRRPRGSRTWCMPRLIKNPHAMFAAAAEERRKERGEEGRRIERGHGAKSGLVLRKLLHTELSLARAHFPCPTLGRATSLKSFMGTKGTRSSPHSSSYLKVTTIQAN